MRHLNGDCSVMRDPLFLFFLTLADQFISCNTSQFKPHFYSTTCCFLFTPLSCTRHVGAAKLRQGIVFTILASRSVECDLACVEIVQEYGGPTRCATSFFN